jgi:MFS family permease
VAPQTLSNLGSALVPVALAFAVLDLTGSATDLGLVLLASRLPNMVLVLTGGVVADRRSRRGVMLASDAVRCLTQAATALLLTTGTARLWELLALQAAHGAAAAFFDPAATGLLPETVGPGRLQQANALLGLSRSATGILGQVGAGILVATVGAGLALGVDAASFAASTCSLALLRTARTTAASRTASFIAQLANGWSEFRARSWLWAPVLHVAMLNLVGAGAVVRPRPGRRQALPRRRHRLGDDRHRLRDRGGPGRPARFALAASAALVGEQHSRSGVGTPDRRPCRARLPAAARGRRAAGRGPGQPR